MSPWLRSAAQPRPNDLLDSSNPNLTTAFVSSRPPFWLNSTKPAKCEHSAAVECGYPTYLEMDDPTRADAEQLLASFVRTTTVSPDDGDRLLHASPDVMVERGKPIVPPRMQYNERSLYLVPGSRTLALLLRGVPGVLSVALCDLPAVPTVPEHTLFSCRPGVGDAFMNLVEIVAQHNSSSVPRVCNWSKPVPSTIPDSGSRTCAAAFPAGSGGLSGIYMVGNQIDRGRDPVTLSLAADGVVFDRHWAVRHGVQGQDIDHGGSCPRYKGKAKGCGYQYPGALIDVESQMMYVSYSIGKEDIGLTRFPLRSLRPPPETSGTGRPAPAPAAGGVVGL